MDKFADLHVHTVYSDGTLTPEVVLRLAADSGLACVSICDHDVVEGIPPALKEALKVSVEVVPGVELSCDIQNSELHILGYFVDHTSGAFLRHLDDLKAARMERVTEMCAKLRALGMDLTAQEVFELSGPGTVGRMHIARLMLQKGYVSTILEAFRRYIGDNGPAYVCRFRLSPEAAINLIVQAGGVPVIAHPSSLSDDSMIAKLVDWGVKGIEVFYPEHNSSLSKRYMQIAEKFDLVMTGGSDFHGQAKPFVKLGQVKIPYEFVDKLRAARDQVS